MHYKMVNNEKMKVLHIGKFYPPDSSGGIETVVYNLVQELSKDITCDVLCFNSNSKTITEFKENSTVIRVSCFGRLFSAPIGHSMIYWFKKIANCYDIIDVHLPNPIVNIAYFLVRPKAKLIIHWHSDIIKQKKLLFFFKPLQNWLLRKASKIIVATPQHIESSIFLKDFRDKCEIIPFGIDISRSQMSDTVRKKVDTIRNKYGPRIILFVGRFVYYKGIEYLVRAMKDVDANLLLIGDGPLKKDLEDIVVELGIEEKIVFLGAVNDEEMPIYYHACDIFVLPSIANSEGFGIVQLEAMACGKPVINTSLPTGVPYVSLNGETGITVPPKNSVALAKAINRLLADNDLRKRYGQNAKQRVEKEFTQELMARRILNAYNKLGRLYG